METQGEVTIEEVAGTPFEVTPGDEKVGETERVAAAAAAAAQTA